MNIYSDIRIFLQYVALRFEFQRIDGKIIPEDRCAWLAQIAKDCRRYKNTDPVVRELCKQMWKFRKKADWMFDQYFAMIYDTTPHACSHRLDMNVQKQYENPDFDPTAPFIQNTLRVKMGYGEPFGGVPCLA